MRQMRVRAANFDYSFSVAILFDAEDGNERWVAKPIKLDMQQFKGDAFDIEPTLKISHELAQGLVDALYKIGFRPTEAPVLQNELTAVKYHLEDMRNLVATFTKSNFVLEKK